MAWDPVSFRRRVLAVIRRIPKGKVATYGQIAALAGFPRNARRVGQVLGRSGPDAVPWQRVVNAQGKVSRRAPRPERAIGAREYQQETLLQGEGIRFVGGRIPLAKYRWNPKGAPERFPQEAPRGKPKRKAAPKAKPATNPTGRSAAKRTSRAKSGRVR